MATFHVKKPSYSAWQWFKTIGPRVIFPPILLWDLIKLGVNRAVGKMIAPIVLPALSADKANFNNLPPVESLDNAALKHARHDVITHDSAHLDTLEITHVSQKDLAPKFQKYMIHFGGNAEVCEYSIPQMQQCATDLQMNVVGFNPRGVINSTGQPKSQADLVTDGIAQVQRLLDQGVSSQNIVLKGHSLGGAIASLVAYHFHQIGKPINVFSGRSFSSITNFIYGHIHSNSDLIPDTPLLKIVPKFLIKFALSATKWEMNAGDAFKAIPDRYKDYIVARTRKSLRQPDAEDDEIIPHYASVHQHLKSERKAKKKAMDSLIKQSSDHEKELIQKERERFSERKMEGGGHNDPLEDLKNRQGKSGFEFFKEFVERAYTDHAVQPKKVKY